MNRISAETAKRSGSLERRVLLEQTPDHYKEFADFITDELASAGGEIFFRGPSGNVYRVAAASDPGGVDGIEICLRYHAGAAQPPQPIIDEDVDVFLRWLIEGVGGEWTVEAFLQTRRLSTIPRSVYKLFPFVGRFTSVGGHYMHYVDVGDEKEKPTVVMLHGNPTWSFLYRDIIKKISGECRAVAPDYIGFGLSDKPPRESWYTLENHVATVTEFIEKLGLRNIILVVQDWGGPIGLSYALEHPQNVAGMLLMNTWAWPQPSSYHLGLMPWRMWHAPFVGTHSFTERNVLVERGLFYATGSFEKFRRGPVLEGYRYPFPTPRSRVGMLAFPRNIPLKPGDLNWDRFEDLRQRLGDIRFPCRLLWGQRDIVFPPVNAHKFHRLIPGCHPPHMIPHGKHFVQEDAPEEISDEILKLAGLR